MNFQKIQLLRQIENNLDIKPFNVNENSPESDIDDALCLLRDDMAQSVELIDKIFDSEKKYSIETLTNSQAI